MRTLAIATLALLAGNATAQFKGENLIQPIPPGYRAGHHASDESGILRELVPEGETVHDWSSMVTTQVMRRGGRVAPDQFLAVMSKQWVEACAGSGARPVADGEQAGYRFALGMLSCPLNPATGKPEIALVKTMQGNDSLYVVQVAFRHMPSSEEIARWSNYLREVKVCDARLPERACPVMGAPGEAEDGVMVRPLPTGGDPVQNQDLPQTHQ